MQTLIIGDIHGCWQELQALLEKSGISDSDVVISLGDLVDRGPDSPAVLSFFKNRPNTFALLGNHERKHVRAAAGLLALNLSQILSREQLGASYLAAVAWMGTLPLYLELPDVVLVHGYLEPNTPLGEQKPTVLTGTMSGGNWLEAHYDRPWYALYQGEKPVIVGHHHYGNFDIPFTYNDRVISLDTNCVHGGKLTGLLLPSFEIVQVDCKTDYWAAARQGYYQDKAKFQVMRQQKERKDSWGSIGADRLAQVVALAEAAAQAVLTRLVADSVYAQLNEREKGLRFSAVVEDKVLLGLLHQARLGRLDVGQVKKIVRDGKQLAQVMEGLQQILEAGSN